MVDLDSLTDQFHLTQDARNGLEAFGALVEIWNGRINLVSRSTIGNIWERHFLDAIQQWSLVPETARSLVDLGSGAGFPGLVFSILAQSDRPSLKITLVESDQRKAAFLRTVSRETGTSAVVLAQRIEAVEPLASDVVTARALAPLPKLLTYAERHLAPGGVAIFPKGAKADQEIDDALANWTFTLQKHPSLSHPDAAILCIGDIARV